MSRSAIFKSGLAALLLSLNASVFALSADTYEVDNSNAADEAAATTAGVTRDEFASAASRAAAKSITSGSTQTHSLHTGGAFSGGGPADRDFVKFTLTVDSDIILQTDENTGPADTFLRLFDSSGNQLSSDDDGNPVGNFTSRLSVSSLSPGTYYASVESYGMRTDDASTIESYKLSYVAGSTGSRLSPVITSKSTAAGALGGQFQYDIASLGSSPIFFQAQSLPPGLTLAGSTIIGVPTQLGTFATTLTANNGAPPASTATVTITVTDFGVIASIAGDGRARLAGDGGLSEMASLSSPGGVAVDGAGNIFVADTNNHVVRRIDSATRTITTIAGTGIAGFSGDNGNARNARLSSPSGVYVDTNNNIFIADTGNHVVRRVSSTGTITRIAGNGGAAGYAGDGLIAGNVAVMLNSPVSVALDSSGNLYIADRDNHCIRRVSQSTGLISTVAGTGGVSGNTGDGGLATAATLSSPSGVLLDSTGIMYISDKDNNRVRKVASGAITNFAGNSSGTSGSSGDGGAPASAFLNQPVGLALDSGNNLYIVDQGNSIIRKVASSIISAVVGGGTPDNSLTDHGASGTDLGAVANAVLTFPSGVAVDATGLNIIIADSASGSASAHRIRRAATASVPAITSALTLSGTKDQPLTSPYTISSTGHPTPTYTAANLPAGLSLLNGVITGVPTVSGVADVVLTATNARGVDTKTLRVTIGGSTGGTLAFSDTTPDITVSPSPSFVNSTTIFVAPTVVNGADLKAYTWDFGDGGASAGDVASHTYTSAGVYTATLTVTDGGTPLTLTGSVGVNATDVTESTIVSKAQFKFNFAAANKDSILLSGSIPLRKTGFTISGATVQARVGSITKSYTLSSKGIGTGTDTKNDVFKLSGKLDSGAIDEAGLFVYGKFSLSIKADTFADDLAALGFAANISTSKPIKVPVLISINGDSYIETVTVVFSSTAKSGTGVKLSEGSSINTR
jgi:PKD repeat protein